MLVIEASVAVPECTTAEPFATYDDELVAPHVMWSEARSALHEAAWRRAIDANLASAAHARLMAAPVTPTTRRDLASESWRLAHELGWAKAYDAEYLALASLLGCRFVTLDGRVRRGADGLGFVVSPTEL